MTSAQLIPMIRNVAEQVRKLRRGQHVLINEQSAECPTYDDYVVITESMAFEAYRTLVKQSRRKPFDPVRQERAWVQLTRSFVKRELEGPSTSLDERHTRNRSRHYALHPNVLWKSWRGVRGTYTNKKVIEQPDLNHETPQDEQLRHHPELLDELKQILYPEAYDLMVSVYLEGRTQREVAVRNCPAGDAAAIVREELRINRILSRARKRARQFLAPSWKHVAADAVAS